MSRSLVCFSDSIPISVRLFITSCIAIAFLLCVLYTVIYILYIFVFNFNDRSSLIVREYFILYLLYGVQKMGESRDILIAHLISFHLYFGYIHALSVCMDLNDLFA